MASPTWMPSSTLHVHRSQFQIPTNAILLRVLEPNDPRLVPSKTRAVEPQKSSKSTNLRLRRADQTQKHVERCGTQELRFVLVYSERTQFEEVARECKRHKRLIVKGSLQNSIRHRRLSTRHHKTRLTKKVERREPHPAARCWYLPFRISFKDNHWMARNDLTHRTHRTRASGFGDFGLKHAQSCTAAHTLLIFAEEN